MRASLAPVRLRQRETVSCHMQPLQMLHCVISPAQNGAQKCTKVVRDTSLQATRSFPFPPSFSANHRRPVTKWCLLPPSFSLSVSLSTPRRSFMRLYKARTSANCSQCAYTCAYVYMRHVATNKNDRVDLKDVNCHLGKETVYENT